MDKKRFEIVKNSLNQAIEYEQSQMVRLTKVTSTHDNLRSDTIVGKLLVGPELGVPLWVVADPVNPDADFRTVRTSPVVEIDGEIIYTENSTYKLEKMDE